MFVVLTSDEYPGDPLHGRGHPVVRGADVEAAVVPRHVAQLRHHRAPQLLPTSWPVRSCSWWLSWSAHGAASLVPRGQQV